MLLYNSLKLSGKIVKVYPVKITPSNVQIQSFTLEHLSTQLEAGENRIVKCKVYCLYVGTNNYSTEDLHQKTVILDGFLSCNSKSQLVVHVQKLKVLSEEKKDVTSKS